MVADSSALFNLAKQVDALAGSTITNLCSDPKPDNLQTWLADLSPQGNVSTADTSLDGLSFRLDAAGFGYGVPFVLPSIGPIVHILADVEGDISTPETPIVPMAGDPVFAFNARSVAAFTVYAGLYIYDDTGLELTPPTVDTADCMSFQSGRTLNTSAKIGLGLVGYDLAADATTRLSWGVVSEAVLALQPTAAYVQIRFSVDLPSSTFVLNTTWLGYGTIYANTDVIAFRDDDSPGWVPNGDGTSSGPAPTRMAWDEVDHPDLFPPEAHTHIAADVTDFDTAVRTNRLDQMAAPTADVSMNSVKIAALQSGTVSTDAVNKGQLDAAIAGVGGTTYEHPPVRVAATTNGTLATAYANGQTLDGVVLATGDRILLPVQTTGSENGFYTVNASGAPTRATDADAAGELVTGSWVYVTDGSKNARSVWTLTNTGTITIGTTAQVWQKTGGEFRYSTSAGITMSPTAGPAGSISGTQIVGIGEGATGGNLSTVSANNGTGVGYHSLYKNNGASNTGVGADALNEASSGTDLTAIGRGAGSFTSGLASTDKTTTGIKNTLLGAYTLAGASSSRSTAVGANANTKFSDTTALGESTNGTQTFQTHTGPRALALTKMATPHTSSGSANDIELMADVDGATKLILKAVLNAKVVPLVHELGPTLTSTFTTAGRPAATAVPAGACYYDTTLSKPGWSDGTVWRDAAGTAI